MIAVIVNIIHTALCSVVILDTLPVQYRRVSTGGQCVSVAAALRYGSAVASKRVRQPLDHVTPVRDALIRVSGDAESPVLSHDSSFQGMAVAVLSAAVVLSLCAGSLTFPTGSRQTQRPSCGYEVRKSRLTLRPPAWGADRQYELKTERTAPADFTQTK